MILLPTSARGVVSATANTTASINKKRPRPSLSRMPSILKNKSSSDSSSSSASDSDSDSVSSSTTSHNSSGATNSVRFHSQHIIPYIHKSDLTIEERQQSWYSRTELSALKRDAKKKAAKEAVITTEVMAIQSRQHQQQHGNCQSTTTIVCTRGLENLLPVNKVERYRRLNHIYSIVVLKQQNDIDGCDVCDGVNDDDDDDDDLMMMCPSSKSPSQIAQEYMFASRQSKIEAYLRAVHDAKYIIQDDDDIIINKNSNDDINAAATFLLQQQQQTRTIAFDVDDVVPPPPPPPLPRVAASVA